MKAETMHGKSLHEHPHQQLPFVFAVSSPLFSSNPKKSVGSKRQGKGLGFSPPPPFPPPLPPLPPPGKQLAGSITQGSQVGSPSPPSLHPPSKPSGSTRVSGLLRT